MKYGDVAVYGQLSVSGSKFPTASGATRGYVLTSNGVDYYWGPGGSGGGSIASTTDLPEGSNLYFTNSRAFIAASSSLPASQIQVSSVKIYGDGSTFDVKSGGNQSLFISNTGNVLIGTTNGLFNTPSVMEVGTLGTKQGVRAGTLYVGSPKSASSINAAVHAQFGYYTLNDNEQALYQNVNGDTFVNAKTGQSLVLGVGGLPSGAPNSNGIGNGVDYIRVNRQGVVIGSGAYTNIANSSVLTITTDNQIPFEIRTSAGSIKAQIDSAGNATFNNIKNRSNVYIVSEDGTGHYTSIQSAISAISGTAGPKTLYINGTVGSSTKITSTISLDHPNLNNLSIVGDGYSSTIISNTQGNLFNITQSINLDGFNTYYATNSETTILVKNNSGVAFNIIPVSGKSININNVNALGFYQPIKLTVGVNKDDVRINLTNNNIKNFGVGLDATGDSSLSNTFIQLTNNIFDNYKAYNLGNPDVRCIDSKFIQIHGNDNKLLSVQGIRNSGANIGSSLNNTTFNSPIPGATGVLNIDATTNFQGTFLQDMVSATSYGGFTIGTVDYNLNLSSKLFEQKDAGATMIINWKLGIPVVETVDLNTIFMSGPSNGGFMLGSNLYPNGTGSNGQKLTTDGAGTLSWT